MDAPRVLAFSPIGVDACFGKLYLYALDRAAGNAAGANPPSAAETKRVRLATKLPQGVIVAAAGSGENVPELQSVLNKAGIGMSIPEGLAHDAMIGVSSVAYTFKWPSEMLWHGKVPDGAFCLNGKEDHCFAHRTFRASAHDAAIIYVERADDYDVSVAAIGMPDALPDAFHRAKDNDDLMAALAALYDGIVNGRDREQQPPSPPLGKATLFNIDNTSSFSLRSVVGRKLPGARTVDEALHGCRLFMNKDGGGVRAGTVMISKGFSMDAAPPVDIDFRAFKNGYLVLVEMTRRNIGDCEPATLVVGWVNVPAGIAAE